VRRHSRQERDLVSRFNVAVATPIMTAAPANARPGAGDPGGLLPVVVDHPAHQQQPDHQDKRRPVLRRYRGLASRARPRLPLSVGYTRAGRQPGKAIYRRRH
jgi:hypothetical protein